MKDNVNIEIKQIGKATCLYVKMERDELSAARFSNTGVSSPRSYVLRCFKEKNKKRQLKIKPVN